MLRRLNLRPVPHSALTLRNDRFKGAVFLRLVDAEDGGGPQAASVHHAWPPFREPFDEARRKAGPRICRKEFCHARSVRSGLAGRGRGIPNRYGGYRPGFGSEKGTYRVTDRTGNTYALRLHRPGLPHVGRTPWKRNVDARPQRRRNYRARGHPSRAGRNSFPFASTARTNSAGRRCSIGLKGRLLTKSSQGKAIRGKNDVLGSWRGLLGVLHRARVPLGGGLRRGLC